MTHPGTCHSSRQGPSSQPSFNLQGPLSVARIQVHTCRLRRTLLPYTDTLKFEKKQVFIQLSVVFLGVARRSPLCSVFYREIGILLKTILAYAIHRTEGHIGQLTFVKHSHTVL